MCPLQSRVSGSSSQSPHQSSQPPACGQLGQNSSVQKKVACHSTKRPHSHGSSAFGQSVLVQAAPAPAMSSSSSISYELCIMVLLCGAACQPGVELDRSQICIRSAADHELWPVASVLSSPSVCRCRRFDFETQMLRGEVDVRLVVRICATRRRKTRYAQAPQQLGPALTSGTALHAAPCILLSAAAPFLSRATG